ncbi:Mitochondrial substrate solute carrier [Fasciola gigantica]|uniref:Mitochondrial substrate solute carrier n=1 Tax=Fasciola gigantica TaxID=46835 RepID=A0A504YW81_FASGI|nr:Mitochondrial substrate solute carrier [Fasciola gigantica]
MPSTVATPKKVGYWYFGGCASAMAAACTHPLDLIKVHLQTQQKKEVGMIGMGIRVFKRDGFLALYNGISASILRQLTYSMTRFGMYETYKEHKGGQMSFAESGVVACISGFCGGIVGNPADMVNVRMQNDMKIPPAERRNYKHAIDGIIQVIKKEGTMKLFNGVSMTSLRAAFMTFGQLAFYDKFKIMLLRTGYFDDKPLTHMLASASAAGVATCITQPFDVMKTRLMNAPPGKYSGLASCGLDIAVTGPLGFFKGLVPAFIRLAPHTILTFVFLEQLKANFGYVPVAKPSA